MKRRVWLLAALYGIATGPAFAEPAPDWAATIADTYVGREWNAGIMACARTAFTLQGGALTGHYWIGDADPFEGDLDQFVPGADHSGVFTWTDRYGQGSLYVRFGADGQTFFSLWGDDPSHMNHPGYGLRGAIANVPRLWQRHILRSRAIGCAMLEPALRCFFFVTPFVSSSLRGSSCSASGARAAFTRCPRPEVTS